MYYHGVDVEQPAVPGLPAKHNELNSYATKNELPVLHSPYIYTCIYCMYIGGNGGWYLKSSYHWRSLCIDLYLFYIKKTVYKCSLYIIYSPCIRYKRKSHNGTLCFTHSSLFNPQKKHILKTAKIHPVNSHFPCYLHAFSDCLGKACTQKAKQMLARWILAVFNVCCFFYGSKKENRVKPIAPLCKLLLYFTR